MWWNQLGTDGNLSWYTKSKTDYGLGCSVGLTVLTVNNANVPQGHPVMIQPVVVRRPLPASFVLPITCDVHPWLEPVIRVLWPLRWPDYLHPISVDQDIRSHHANRGASNFTPGDFAKFLTPRMTPLVECQVEIGTDPTKAIHAMVASSVRRHFDDLGRLNSHIRSGAHVSVARGNTISDAPSYTKAALSVGLYCAYPVLLSLSKKTGVLSLTGFDVWARFMAPVVEELVKQHFATQWEISPWLAGALFGAFEFFCNDFSRTGLLHPMLLLRVALHSVFTGVGTGPGIGLHMGWNNMCYQQWAIPHLGQISNYGLEPMALSLSLRRTALVSLVLLVGSFMSLPTRRTLVGPSRDRPCQPEVLDIDPSVEIKYEGKRVLDMASLLQTMDNPAPTGKDMTWVCRPTDDADIWSPAGNSHDFHFGIMICTRLGKQLRALDGRPQQSGRWMERHMHHLVDRVTEPCARPYDHLLEVWLQHQREAGRYSRYANILPAGNTKYREVALKCSKRTPCNLKQDEVLFKPRNTPKGLYGRTVECVAAEVNLVVGPYDHYLTSTIKTHERDLELFRVPDSDLYTFPALGWSNTEMDRCYNWARRQGARVLMVHGDDVFYQDFAGGFSHEHDLSCCDHSLQTEAMNYEENLFRHWTKRLGFRRSEVAEYHTLSRNVARSVRHMGGWSVQLDQRPTGSTRTSVGNTMLILNVFTEAYLVPGCTFASVRAHADARGLVLTGSETPDSGGFSTFLKGVFLPCEDGDYHWFRLPSSVMKSLKCNAKSGMQILMRLTKLEKVSETEASRRWLAVMSTANATIPHLPLLQDFYSLHARPLALFRFHDIKDMLPYALEGSVASISPPTQRALALLSRRYGQRTDIFDMLEIELSTIVPGGTFVSDVLAHMVRVDYG